MDAEKEMDGKLEIKLRNPITGDIITEKIYVIKLIFGGEEYWKYTSQNGKKIGKVSPLNPKLQAEKIAREYAQKGLDGKIIWQYRQKNHTQQNEKRVPEEIPGSI